MFFNHSKIDKQSSFFSEFTLNYQDALYIAPPAPAAGTPPPACSLSKPKKVNQVEEYNVLYPLNQNLTNGSFDTDSVEVYDKTQDPFIVMIPENASRPLFGEIQTSNRINVGFLSADYKQSANAAVIDLGSWEQFRAGSIKDIPKDNGKGGYDIYVWGPQLSEAWTSDINEEKRINLGRIYFAQVSPKGRVPDKASFTIRINDNCFYVKGPDGKPDQNSLKKTRLYKFFSYDSTNYRKTRRVGFNNVSIPSTFTKIDKPTNYMEIIYNKLLDKLEAKIGRMTPTT